MITTTTPADPATAELVVERTLDLPASPERVWQALTDPDQLGHWFGSTASLPLHPGAIGWFDFGEHGRFACRVETIDPGRHLVWRWAEDAGVEVDDGPSTLVEWWLDEGRGGGTRLRLRESGFRAARNHEVNTAGWFEELGELRELLAAEPWQVPIQRRLELRADRDRVWRALSDDGELRQWWGSTVPVEVRAGWEGWFAFPEHGMHAVRIEVVEPPRYLAWRWIADEAGVPLEEARQPLVVEWLLEARPDGGTTLRLMESGFIGPDSRKDNTDGWTDEVLPGLVRLVDGEISAVEAGA
jgi:uncharacterized protein YndB with AHSA1/START domain